ncbi:MAG: glycosyltransferase family 39 protein [Desulfobacterales bacterium]
MVTAGAVAAGGAVAEVVILTLGGFIFFRRCGNTVAESGTYGLMTVLMGLSLVFQASFLFNLPAASLFIEGLVTALALAFVVRRRSELHLALTAVRSLWSRHPLAFLLVGLVWSYLGLTAIVIPPGTIYWESLGRLLTVERRPALFPAGLSAAAGASPAGLVSANTLVLPHLFLRFHTDAGIGLLGFAAYLSIGFSVYALSRRYAWPATAFTVALMALSLPRMVYLATSPGYDNIPTAAALFCLLAIYRTVESPNTRDLYLLVLGLVFMISTTTLQLAFPLVLAALAALLLFRRHGLATWWHLVAARPAILLLVAVPALVFSPLLPLAYLLATTTGSGSSRLLPVAAYNTDGLQGAAANALRYLLQSIDVTAPVDGLVNWAMGFSISGLLQNLYETLVTPVFDGRGAAAAFNIALGADERFSWFGPFGFILILPAVAYAARRAPRRLKAVAVALGGYFFLVALIPAWQPENVRYLDVFFLCGSVCTAFFLPPWRVSRKGRRVLLAIGIALLLYAAVGNEHKPAIVLPHGFLKSGADSPATEHRPKGKGPAEAVLPAGSIWSAAEWGRKRCWAAALIFGDNRLEEVADLVTEPERLWVVYADLKLAYPFLRRFPAAAAVAISDLSPVGVSSARSRHPAYLVFVDGSPPPWMAASGSKLLWQAARGTATVPGALVRRP